MVFSWVCYVLALWPGAKSNADIARDVVAEPRAAKAGFVGMNLSVVCGAKDGHASKAGVDELGCPIATDEVVASSALAVRESDRPQEAVPLMKAASRSKPE